MRTKAAKEVGIIKTNINEMMPYSLSVNRVEVGQTLLPYPCDIYGFVQTRVKTEIQPKAEG